MIPPPGLSLQRVARAFLVAFLLLGTTERAVAAYSGEITHVILLSLQRPGNVNDRNLLVRAARVLRRARGVTDFRVGPGLSGTLPGREIPFDLAVVITFRNERALRHFENDQHQQAALDRALAPLVRRRLVYDFVNE